MQERIEKTEKKVDKVEKNLEQVEKDADKAFRIAIASLDAKNKESERKEATFERTLKKGMIEKLALIFLNIITVLSFVYYITNYGIMETTTTTETTTQEGLYNYYGVDGDIVSSDLSLDEMQALIDLNRSLEDGQDNN